VSHTCTRKTAREKDRRCGRLNALSVWTFGR
jgi:hypothetical protein